MVLRIDVPAKINLWLEVIRKRADGYHDLSSLMLPIAIYDRLEVELHSKEIISLACEHPDVPTDERNLAWRAAALYIRSAGWNTGVRIRLFKNIPVGAGLGGGSADAAAVLLALNRLSSANPIPLSRLHELATQLGADVPFFLYENPALATGIGEELQRVEGLPAYPVVLIKPPLMVSTGWVYGSLKLTRGKSRITVNRLKARPWQLHDVMENDLETVTLREYPLLVQIKDWLLAHGAIGALMSGSGPTVFGVFTEKGAAERIGEVAKNVWEECWVATTQVLGVPAAQ